MTNEIVVKKYTDLKPFFEQKATEGLLTLTNSFFSEIEKASIDLVDKLSTAGNVVSTAAAGGAIIYEVAKANNIHFEANLTPEMEKALQAGIGKFQQSHKITGDFHTMFQWNNGTKENITLRQIQEVPNYANIAVLANQMMMQQTLTSIQNTLMDFAEETDRQLSLLQQAVHDERMLRALTAKSDFETYLQEGEEYKAFMLHSNNEAFNNVKIELKRKLEELEETREEIRTKRLSKEMEELIKKQDNCMTEIIETLYHFQVISNIELYLAYKKEVKQSIQEVEEKYIDVLLENFTEDRLWLLSGLSKLPNDIWHENFMPCIEKIKQNKEELLLCQKNVKENIMVAE